MSTSTAHLVIKTGCSEDKNTARAMEQALQPLLAFKERPALALLYCSVKQDVRRAVAEAHRGLPDVPLIGCTTTGELCTRGILQGGAVLTGLFSEALRAAVGYGADVYRDPVGAGKNAVLMAKSKLGEITQQRKVCLVHTAGFTLAQKGVEEDVLTGIRAELDESWIIVGGSAGDDVRFLENFQFADGQVFNNAVVVALIATDLQVSHSLEHGFVPTERTFRVTDAKDNVVRKIEGKLALDLYADLLGAPKSKLTAGLNLLRLSDKVPKFLMSLSQKAGLTPQKVTENIPFFTYAIENPFGIKTESGTFIAKVPKTITSEGYLEFQTRIPTGQELTLMKLDKEKTLSASARAIGHIKSALGAEPKLVMIYECSGRYMYLYKEMDRLMDSIKQSTHAELVGFFSSAEQGLTAGLGCQTHNYTASILGLGDGV